MPSLSPCPCTPNTLTSAEALVSPASPLRGQAGFHRRQGGCFCSPRPHPRVPLSLTCRGETRRLGGHCEAGDEESGFCSVLRNLSTLLFPQRGVSWEPPSDMAEATHLLVQYFQPAVNHTSGSWLYNLQYVKLEIAQELSGSYLIYLEL